MNSTNVEYWTRNHCTRKRSKKGKAKVEIGKYFCLSSRRLFPLHTASVPVFCLISYYNIYQQPKSCKSMSYCTDSAGCAALPVGVILTVLFIVLIINVVIAVSEVVGGRVRRSPWMRGRSKYARSVCQVTVQEAGRPVPRSWSRLQRPLVN